MNAISNNEIKKIRSLSQKKFRDAEGLFVVEGEKMVEEAVRSPFTVEKIYRREEIGEEAMSRISQLSSPSPVLAVVRRPAVDAATEEEISGLVGNEGFYVGLDRLRDPGNLGTIIRIADWFGADGVFATPDSVDLFNPKVVQATMGAIFRVKFRYVDLAHLSRMIIARGGKVYGTFLDGTDLYATDLACGDQYPVMTITGNESEGISPEIGALVSDRLYIPPYPQDDPGSESLNAAVATAVTLAEFRRRLTHE